MSRRKRPSWGRRLNAALMGLSGGVLAAQLYNLIRTFW